MSLWYWMADTSIEFGGTMFVAGVCSAWLFDAVLNRAFDVLEVVRDWRAKCST